MLCLWERCSLKLDAAAATDRVAAGQFVPSEIGEGNSWKWRLHLEQGRSNLSWAVICPTGAYPRRSGNSLPGQNLADPLPTPSKSNDFRPALFRAGRDSAETCESWRRSGFRWLGQDIPDRRFSAPVG